MSCDYIILKDAHPCRLYALFQGALYDEEMNKGKLNAFQEACQENSVELLCLTEVSRNPFECLDDSEETQVECENLFDALELVVGRPHLLTVFRVKTTDSANKIVNALEAAVSAAEGLEIDESQLFSVHINDVEKKCMYITCD